MCNNHVQSLKGELANEAAIEIVAFFFVPGEVAGVLVCIIEEGSALSLQFLLGV